jgi:tyrosine-protein kinase Etk/Wzc
LGHWLGVKNHRGLGDLIEGSATLSDVILTAEELPVSFMVRGNSRLSAAELLHLPSLKTCFREIGNQFDLVLVDSPPTNLMTDAELLASACDAVLLVARALYTTQKALTEASRKLSSFRIIGAVLNGQETALPSYRYQSYYEERGNQDEAPFNTAESKRGLGQSTKWGK